ncbi:uncharacterized protein [Littorina saxatilis]|uniref:uncharacterized protein isoform X2 n=1 Tax=Littorina saxatilis TaxID=31220 RepID=UPI0038B43ED7
MDEIETDVDILLEGLRCQKKDFTGMKRTLQALASVFKSNEESKEYFRQIAGLQYVNKLLFSQLPTSVLQDALICLACATENDVFCQNTLTKPEIFRFLHKVFSEKRSEKKYVHAAVYLAINLIAGNSTAQHLAKEHSIVADLLGIFRECGEKCGVSSAACSEELDLWSSVVTALSMCVNNPQNDVNQRLCSTVLPLCFQVVTDNKWRQLAASLLSFAGLTVAGNSFNQNRVRKCGGLDTLIQQLGRCERGVEKDINQLHTAIGIVSVIDACITDNEENSRYFVWKGGVRMVMALVSQPVQLTTHSLLQLMLALGHALECADGKSAPLTAKDQTVLVRLLTGTDDEDFVQAVKYVLNIWGKQDDAGTGKEDVTTTHRIKQLSSAMELMDALQADDLNALQGPESEGDARVPTITGRSPIENPSSTYLPTPPPQQPSWDHQQPPPQLQPPPPAYHQLQQQQYEFCEQPQGYQPQQRLVTQRAVSGHPQSFQHGQFPHTTSFPFQRQEGRSAAQCQPFSQIPEVYSREKQAWPPTLARNSYESQGFEHTLAPGQIRPQPQQTSTQYELSQGQVLSAFTTGLAGQQYSQGLPQLLRSNNVEQPEVLQNLGPGSQRAHPASMCVPSASTYPLYRGSSVEEATRASGSGMPRYVQSYQRYQSPALQSNQGEIHTLQQSPALQSNQGEIHTLQQSPALQSNQGEIHTLQQSPLHRSSPQAPEVGPSVHDRSVICRSPPASVEGEEQPTEWMAFQYFKKLMSSVGASFGKDKAVVDPTHRGMHEAVVDPTHRGMHEAESPSSGSARKENTERAPSMVNLSDAGDNRREGASRLCDRESVTSPASVRRRIDFAQCQTTVGPTQLDNLSANTPLEHKTCALCDSHLTQPMNISDSSFREDQGFTLCCREKARDAPAAYHQEQCTLSCCSHQVQTTGLHGQLSDTRNDRDRLEGGGRRHETSNCADNLYDHEEHRVQQSDNPKVGASYTNQFLPLGKLLNVIDVNIRKQEDSEFRVPFPKPNSRSFQQKIARDVETPESGASLGAASPCSTRQTPTRKGLRRAPSRTPTPQRGHLGRTEDFQSSARSSGFSERQAYGELRESFACSSPAGATRRITRTTSKTPLRTSPGKFCSTFSSVQDLRSVVPPSPAASEFDCELLKAAATLNVKHNRSMFHGTSSSYVDLNSGSTSALRKLYPQMPQVVLERLPSVSPYISGSNSCGKSRLRSLELLPSNEDDEVIPSSEASDGEADGHLHVSLTAESLSETSSCMSVYSVQRESPHTLGPSGDGGDEHGDLCPGCSTTEPLNSRNFNIAMETSVGVCPTHRKIRQIERDFIVKRASKRRLEKKLSYKQWKENLRGSGCDTDDRKLGQGQENQVKGGQSSNVYDFSSSSSDPERVSPPRPQSTPLPPPGSRPPPGSGTRGGAQRRRRVPYTQGEERQLLEGVKALGKSWNQILYSFSFHPSRTAVDLMEKYKRMQKQAKATRAAGRNRKPPLSMCEERRLRRGVSRLGHNWTAILRSGRFAYGRTAEELRDRWRVISKRI